MPFVQRYIKRHFWIYFWCALLISACCLPVAVMIATSADPPPPGGLIFTYLLLVGGPLFLWWRAWRVFIVYLRRDELTEVDRIGIVTRKVRTQYGHHRSQQILMNQYLDLEDGRLYVPTMQSIEVIPVGVPVRFTVVPLSSPPLPWKGEGIVMRWEATR